MMAVVEREERKGRGGEGKREEQTSRERKGGGQVRKEGETDKQAIEDSGKGEAAGW